MHYLSAFFDKTYANEKVRNAEVIYAHPRIYSAIDEVTESEWKFVAENLDAMYPPIEVTLERVLEFFADYIKVEPPLIENAVAEVEEVNKPAEKFFAAAGKTYFIEVYTNEIGNSDNDAEFVAQYEYQSLLAAYDAAEEIKAEFADADFYKLEIVDSEDLNRIYYKINNVGSVIFEPELQEAINERKKAETEVEKITIKNPLQEKIAGLRATEKNISEKYLNLCRNLYVKIDGEYHSAVGFDDYVTKFHNTFYCKEGNNYVEDTAAYVELKAIECEWNAIFKKLEYFEKIEDKADILKAKIAEQKNSRKPIIDWAKTFKEMKISEILDLQKDFKKFLKLGEIDLAENVFSMLKTLCRNYRAAA